MLGIDGYWMVAVYSIWLALVKVQFFLNESVVTQR